MKKRLPTVAVALVMTLAIPDRVSVAGGPRWDGRAFVATSDAKRARAYYGETLGMHLLRDEPFALVFDANGTMLPIAKVPKVTPAAYTVLGWEVGDISATVKELMKRGVVFESSPVSSRTISGCGPLPIGRRSRGSGDPDNNGLSVTQFP